MDPRDVKIKWRQTYSLMNYQIVQRVISEQAEEVDHDLSDDPCKEANALIALIKSKL